ncbi:unnamed protein product [Somion occarium]|uniref:Uncharacterized protein n=1 Tax=Somion occarium TaxID=3059160 RepID=A0ABP1DWM8_9APHY
MQPTFILTRTFAICGFLVGAISVAHAAPVPYGSPRSAVDVRSPTPLFPISFSDVVAAVKGTVEKRGPFMGACILGCRRDSESEEVAASEEKREPTPMPIPEPGTNYVGACGAGCLREIAEEVTAIVEEKREPEPEPEPQPEPYMGACVMGCRRSVDERSDISETIEHFTPSGSTPLDILAREPQT